MQHNANYLLDCASGWCYGVKEATFIWYVDVTLLAGFAGDDAALVSTTAVYAQGWLCWSAVFLSVVPGQDHRHLGRYGPEGQLRSWCFAGNTERYAQCKLCSCSHRGDGTGAVLGTIYWPVVCNDRCSGSGAVWDKVFHARCCARQVHFWSRQYRIPWNCRSCSSDGGGLRRCIMQRQVQLFSRREQWKGLRFCHRQGVLDLKCGREAHFAPFFALLQFSGVERQVSVFEPSMTKSSSLSRAPRVAGRRESDSQVTCHPIHCMLLCGMDRHVMQAKRPHHHHHLRNQLGQDVADVPGWRLWAFSICRYTQGAFLLPETASAFFHDVSPHYCSVVGAWTVSNSEGGLFWYRRRSVTLATLRLCRGSAGALLPSLLSRWLPLRWLRRDALLRLVWLDPRRVLPSRPFSALVVFAALLCGDALTATERVLECHRVGSAGWVLSSLPWRRAMKMYLRVGTILEVDCWIDAPVLLS